MRTIAAHDTPSGTRMMWKPSVNAICERAHGTGFTASIARELSTALDAQASSAADQSIDELVSERRGRLRRRRAEVGRRDLHPEVPLAVFAVPR